MIEDGKEVPLPSIINITGISRVTRSGRVFNKMAENGAGKEPQTEEPTKQASQPSGDNQEKNDDEILKLIQKSEYNIVDQLLHTPSRISVLSLLLSSEAHMEAC